MKSTVTTHMQQLYRTAEYSLNVFCGFYFVINHITERWFVYTTQRAAADAMRYAYITDEDPQIMGVSRGGQGFTCN